MLAARLRSVLAAGLLALVLGGCRTALPPDPARIAPLADALGDLLLAGFDGTAVAGNGELEALLCRARVGNVLLFGRNIVDPAQLAGLTGDLRARARACTGRPPLVAVDAEGGRTMRLGPATGYTPTLSAAELGDADDLALTELEAFRIGRMLREAGIDWALAPVVDVGYNPANTVIVGAGRSFGASPARVAAHAHAFVRGLRRAGVRSTLKHFPGHGGSYGDSHQGFVDVTGTAAPAVELEPYRRLLAKGAVESVMTAHVFNGRLDRRYPATLSRATLERVLRRQLGFDGLVVSDDLRMRAIEQHYGVETAAVRALAAGVDVLVVADDRLPDGRSAAALVLAALREALAEGRLPADRVATALARMHRFAAATSASPPR
jgi:beta-N-acetylhexosaminidase